MSSNCFNFRKKKARISDKNFAFTSSQTASASNRNFNPECNSKNNRPRGGRGRGCNFNMDANSCMGSTFPQVPTENDVSTWRYKDFYALVRAFANNNESNELLFPSSLSASQRSDIHRIAAIFKLDHCSSGSAPNRVLKLTKMSGGVGMQERQGVAMANGSRIKTIDGYQGAQLIKESYLQDASTGKNLSLLKRYWFEMSRALRLEANRMRPRNKQLRAAQPGLSAAPTFKRNDALYSELQRFRKALPTYFRRDDIVRTVRENNVVVICGGTGSGKTTQVPQMLYDAHIFPSGVNIVCTQPRRISALSVACRVAEERGEACGSSCGYIIRFENVTSPQTRILYETTGILLRHLHSDPELHGVGCVIVDEVHERDVETDFCLLLLRDRLMAQHRNPEKFPLQLKVVVMSATVQIEALVNYFSGANGGRQVPLISIVGTLFPVEEYFLEDAIQWAGVPAASVPLMSLIPKNTGSKVGCDAGIEGAGERTLYEKLRSAVFNDKEHDAETMVPYDLVYKLILHLHQKDVDRSSSVLVFLPGWAAIVRISDMLRRSPAARELSVLMLHSSLTSSEQQCVFLRPPKRFRKVVLATSIAETSITIDDVVYVIDSGLVKGTSYDPSGNTCALKATLIGQANGKQRRGRAGRCRAGMCVHLLPAAVYNALPEFLPPQIVCTPLEEVCLQVKAIQPNERCVSVLARAMDPPPVLSVQHAVEFLTEAGALTANDEQLTNLGRALAQLPIHPLLGKMLFAAACFGVLDSVGTIAAGLSVKSPFVKPQVSQRAAVRESLQRLDEGDLSDHLCLLKLYRGWLRSGRSFQYADEHFADATTLRALDRTKQQLINLVLRSPLLRRSKNPTQDASRYNENTGLVRLVMLWAMYPRIATIEYRANRQTNLPQVFCWDNKPAVFSMNSVLAFAKRQDIMSRSFVIYYERMQLDAMLTLFDASCMSPVDVALCTRQLTVRPLEEIPKFMLVDQESKLAPPAYLDVDTLPDKKNYSVLMFDGDKKLYVTEQNVACAIRMARECMDYYLALAIKKLRADVFPQELISVIAALIGYPIPNTPAFAKSHDFDVAPRSHPVLCGVTHGNAAFIRNYHASNSSSDEDEHDAPLIDDDEDFDATLLMTDEQQKRVIAAFGDLAVFHTDGAVHLLAAAQEAEKNNDRLAVLKANLLEVTPASLQEPVEDQVEEEEEEEDIIVAQQGGMGCPETKVALMDLCMLYVHKLVFINLAEEKDQWLSRVRAQWDIEKLLAVRVKDTAQVALGTTVPQKVSLDPEDELWGVRWILSESLRVMDASIHPHFQDEAPIADHPSREEQYHSLSSPSVIQEKCLGINMASIKGGIVVLEVINLLGEVLCVTIANVSSALRDSSTQHFTALLVPKRASCVDDSTVYSVLEFYVSSPQNDSPVFAIPRKLVAGCSYDSLVPISAQGAEISFSQTDLYFPTCFLTGSGAYVVSNVIFIESHVNKEVLVEPVVTGDSSLIRISPSHLTLHQKGERAFFICTWNVFRSFTTTVPGDFATTVKVRSLCSVGGKRLPFIDYTIHGEPPRPTDTNPVYLFWVNTVMVTNTSFSLHEKALMKAHLPAFSIANGRESPML